MTAIIVRSDRVVLPGGMRPAAVRVEDGRIVEIAGRADHPSGGHVLDAGALVVMPGLVDTHVHINDPGRAEWEGFAHATRAAAAGGVTTLIDMPLNSVPATTSLEGLDAKRRSAAGRLHVDVGFWGGVVPGNTASLEPLARAGVRGFKCFLSPSGVDEFPHVSEDDLREALPTLAALRLPLLVHAELPARLKAPDPRHDPRRYATWLESRPVDAEHAAIELLISLASEYRAAIHVVHLASAGALPALSAARRGRIPITVETCPHYLTFAAEDVADGATAWKCAPPIRERAHREALWGALARGDIDLIATDHSPAPPALKHLDDGDFVQAWGGVASLQLGLRAVWTGAAGRGIALERVAHWMAGAPAALAGLGASKGTIAEGQDADLVIWDPEAESEVDSSLLEHRHRATPYAGRRLRGRVQTTLLRGEVVYDAGRFADVPPGLILP
jgi:allantoinase